MAPRAGRFYRAGMLRTSALVVSLIAAVSPATADPPADALGARRLGAGPFQQLWDDVTAPLAHEDDSRQVALAADVGLTGGGVATPGGLRIGGHYLYRLTDRDWFDSALAFTFGGRGDACAAARPDGMTCDRRVTDGFAADLALGVRRELEPRQGFTPYLRLGGFVRALRFTDVGGFAIGGELGAGVRAPVHGPLAVVAGASAFLGVARLGEPVGGGRQLGLTITVGAEVGME